MIDRSDIVEVFHAVDGWRWERKSAVTHQVVARSPHPFTEHRYALEAATLQNPDAAAILDVDRLTALHPRST